MEIHKIHIPHHQPDSYCCFDAHFLVPNKLHVALAARPAAVACEGLHFRRGKEGTALEAPGMRHPPASVHRI